MIQPIQIPSNNNCLLTYSFDTYPTPLQVSPDDDDKHQHGIITVVVSNPSDSKVYCEEIKLTLPVGAGSAHLTETPDTISAFVYTNKATKAWKVQNNNGVLTATPKAGAFIEITSSDSLVFYIYYIQVNKQIGTFSIDIAERTSENSSSVTTKPYTQSFSKFPHGFFFKDLAVYKETQEDGNTVLSPITYLDNSDNGEKIALAWHGGSNATYTLFYSGQPDPDGVTLGENNSKNNGNKRWWFYLEPIRDTTTFVLKASVTQGGEKLEAYLSTTVVVKNPDIQAKSLEVGDTNTLELKEGKNQQPTISTSGDQLRIAANNSIAFWADGSEGNELEIPTMILERSGELKMGEVTRLRAGRLELGSSLITPAKLTADDLTIGKTYLKSGELKIESVTLSSEGLNIGEGDIMLTPGRVTTTQSKTEGLGPAESFEPAELKVGNATLKSGEIKVGGSPLVLKEGRNQDPTISTSVDDKWLRIGANNSIAFWANGGADTNNEPQMTLEKTGELKVGNGEIILKPEKGRKGEEDHKSAELEVGDTTLTSGELKIGDTTLKSGELEMGNTTLTSASDRTYFARSVGDNKERGGMLVLGRYYVALYWAGPDLDPSTNVNVGGEGIIDMQWPYYALLCKGNQLILRRRSGNPPSPKGRSYTPFQSVELVEWASSANTSDIKLKTNITPISDVLAALAAIRGVQFDWKDKTMGEGKQLGVIAQEVEKVYPEVVEGIEGNKIVHYEKLVPVLIEGVKALTTRNEALEQRVQAQESQLKALTARLDKLERKA